MSCQCFECVRDVEPAPWELACSEMQWRDIMQDITNSAIARYLAMPDENTALLLLFEAQIRLKELGWKEIMYCPKDGSTFKVIEPMSTGIHDCLYLGEWPSGGFWTASAGDLWPSRPIMFKPEVKSHEQ